METLKYTVIKTKTQYKAYCKALEELVGGARDKGACDEVELLTVLIEKWDNEHSRLLEADPIELLHSFMQERNLKARDLVILLKVSKGYVSDILNYKKGLSKKVIRDLASFFKVSQEAFNRPYKLKSSLTVRSRKSSLINQRFIARAN